MNYGLQSSLFTHAERADVARIAGLNHRRQRLRERMFHSGSDALSDGDLLESLLLALQPHTDPTPLALRLLQRFGDLGAIFGATPAEIAATQGSGSALSADLAMIGVLTRHSLRSKVIGRPVVSGWQDLLDYCSATLGKAHIECLRAVFLNVKNVVIADEELGRGTIDHVPVYPREVVKRALELNAKAIILVHNHPSGDPTPSPEDIAMTRQMVEACHLMAITLHDHVIVGSAETLSFRAEGLL
ncbi:RadC family protein [Palleronia caenipelagi]|uniref:DNA repair protein RadC n=1 Tax=Palleronia caenipelagi TaxID=2489174 RepID=A0A547Q8D3_9RHOB|nr:DNA repair protein RadC [Palleronia caenipelagi]TRD22642.1 DNA repair protein RadC [Palleronia caenipelagi]